MQPARTRHRRARPLPSRDMIRRHGGIGRRPHGPLSRAPRVGTRQVRMGHRLPRDHRPDHVPQALVDQAGDGSAQLVRVLAFHSENRPARGTALSRATSGRPSHAHARQIPRDKP
jgi:hypothetical protein